jgi:hypothetical protein
VRLGTAFAALLCGALLLLPGCGSDSNGKPIPAGQADRLIKAVQAADQYSADGRCSRAHTKVRDARFLLGQVPTSVDKDVRQGISDGLSRLDSLIGSECQKPQNTQTETTPTQTETTQTQTTQTETQPTQTETTPTQTETTQTQTTLTETTPTQTNTGTTTTGTGGTPPGQDQANGNAGGATG